MSMDGRVVYWGDCDEAGYGILSGLRSVFPHARSVLMDESSWLRLEDAIHQFATIT
jgi:hypothetical protein